MVEVPGRAVGVLTAAELETVLAAAAWGASLQGARSWATRSTAAGIEVHADGPAGPPAALRPADRGMRIAGGAALLNLRVAVRAIGVSAVAQLLPDAHQPRLLAVLSAQSRAAATAGELAVSRPLEVDFHARPGLAGEISESAQSALRRAARAEQTWLAPISDASLAEFEAMVAGGQQDGDATMRGGVGSMPVAVVGTIDDTPLAQLQAGQSLQRVLLTAVISGLSPSLEMQVLNVPVARRRLRALIGGALWPQAVVRLHHPSSPGSDI